MHFRTLCEDQNVKKKCLKKMKCLEQRCRACVSWVCEGNNIKEIGREVMLNIPSGHEKKISGGGKCPNADVISRFKSLTKDKILVCLIDETPHSGNLSTEQKKIDGFDEDKILHSRNWTTCANDEWKELMKTFQHRPKKAFCPIKLKQERPDRMSKNISKANKDGRERLKDQNSRYLKLRAIKKKIIRGLGIKESNATLKIEDTRNTHESASYSV